MADREALAALASAFTDRPGLSRIAVRSPCSAAFAGLGLARRPFLAYGVGDPARRKCSVSEPFPASRSEADAGRGRCPASGRRREPGGDLGAESPGAEDEVEDVAQRGELVSGHRRPFAWGRRERRSTSPPSRLSVKAAAK